MNVLLCLSATGNHLGCNLGCTLAYARQRFRTKGLVAVLVTLAISSTACSHHGPSGQVADKTDHSVVDEIDELDELDRLDDDSLDDLDSDYTAANGSAWLERTFAGKTLYTISGNNHGTVKGEASGTASLLYRQHSIDVSKSPWLNWRWKVSNTYGELDEQTRAGDDYPARIYVVAQTGSLPWDTHAINYVWSSNSPVGTSWNNPFTSKARMIVLQSGDQRVGEWVMEKRDVVADFKTHFNLDIDELSGYAIMVDGDNSGSSGTGWFSDIRFGAK